MGFGVQKVSSRPEVNTCAEKQLCAGRMVWRLKKPMELGQVWTPICKQMHQKEEHDSNEKIQAISERCELRIL